MSEEMTIKEIRFNQDKIFNEFDYLKNSLLEVLKSLEKVKEKKQIIMSDRQMCEMKHEKMFEVQQIELNQIKDDIESVKIEISDIKNRIDKMAI
jgi:hypothetical protein